VHRQAVAASIHASAADADGDDDAAPPIAQPPCLPAAITPASSVAPASSVPPSTPSLPPSALPLT